MSEFLDSRNPDSTPTQRRDQIAAIIARGVMCRSQLARADTAVVDNLTAKDHSVTGASQMAEFSTAFTPLVQVTPAKSPEARD